MRRPNQMESSPVLPEVASIPRDAMHEVKEAVAKFNSAEVQHLLHHIVNTRDEVLCLYTFTKEYFDMTDRDEFKAFKAFLMHGDAVDLRGGLRDAIRQLLADSETADAEELEATEQGAVAAAGEGASA